ncbi:MAG: OmpP1/FadL family transporter [Labilibaculum antarcticum]
MKNTTKIIFSALIVLAGMFSTQPVKATDGYFGVGYGAQNKGLAGAGIAWYQNSLISGNPAGHVFLGTQYQVGVGFFNPNREYTIGNGSDMSMFKLAPGTVESDSKLFLMPSMGANWMINEKSSFSATMFGNGGMNTDYPTNTFLDPNSSTTGVDLGQMFVGLTYSRKITEKHSFGVTALLAYQYFEAKGLGMFGAMGMSSDADKLTDNGHDNAFGYGVKFGYLGELAKGLHLGASYQTMLYMSEFDDYAGLFAEQGDFNIPSTWTVGLAYEINEDWAVMADYKAINYTDVASVSNPLDMSIASPVGFDAMGNMFPNPNFKGLGDDAGAGFGWEDIGVIKFGVEYAGIEGWTLRGGYSHCDQPIQKSEVMFNMLAPGVIEDHITLGCSKTLGDTGKALHLALVYAMPASVKGYNPMDPSQSIEIEMNQIEVEIAFTF